MIEVSAINEINKRDLIQLKSGADYAMKRYLQNNRGHFIVIMTIKYICLIIGKKKIMLNPKR